MVSWDHNTSIIITINVVGGAGLEWLESSQVNNAGD